MKDLLDIPFDSGLKFVSFYITKMYSNVPVKELINLLATDFFLNFSTPCI